MTVRVLGANVFIHGADRPLPAGWNPVTVPAVTAELEQKEPGRRFDMEQVRVLEPDPETVQRVEEAAAEKGEDLSTADVAVIALALEREGVVVSDDYGVQNVAASLDVSYEGFLREAIRDEITWTYRCTGCGKTFDADRESCPVCGSSVTRAPGERRSL